MATNPRRPTARRLQPSPPRRGTPALRNAAAGSFSSQEASRPCARGAPPSASDSAFQPAAGGACTGPLTKAARRSPCPRSYEPLSSALIDDARRQYDAIASALADTCDVLLCETMASSGEVRVDARAGSRSGSPARAGDGKRWGADSPLRCHYSTGESRCERSEPHRPASVGCLDSGGDDPGPVLTLRFCSVSLGLRLHRTAPTLASLPLAPSAGHCRLEAAQRGGVIDRS